MPVRVPVEYVTDGGGLERDLTKDSATAGKSAGKKSGESFGKSFGEGAKALIGPALELATIGGGVEFLKGSVEEAREAQKVGAATQAILKATGGAAGITEKHIDALADSQSRLLGVDDETVKSGENVLLKYKQISNQVGNGNDIFDRATKAAGDLAGAGFGTVVTASQKLGRALADPEHGVTALTRAGVVFTAQQKAQIKALQDSGNLLGAQRIVLDKIQHSIGGVGAATATQGEKMSAAFKNTEEALGTVLLPQIDKFEVVLTTQVVPAVQGFVDGMEDGTGKGGQFAHVLGEIGTDAKAVVGFIDGIPGPVKKIGVEALVAYKALTVLGGGLTATGAKVKEFTLVTATSEERVAALGSVAGAAAGTAGLLLLAKSADTAAGSVKDLEGVSGAILTGAGLGSFAGPEGAAVGAGIGAIVAEVRLLGIGLHNTAKDATISAGSFKDYEDTLSGVNAATTKATRTLALQRLESSGLLQVEESMGLTERQAVSASLGNVAARTKLSKALLTSTTATQSQKDAIEKETGAVGAARLAQLKANVATAVGAKNTDIAREALRRYIAQPANKKVSITGLELITQEAKNTLAAIREVFGAAKDLNNIKGDVGNLLQDPLKPTHKAAGGPVYKGKPYVVGEQRPELFVPDQNGRILPSVPNGSGQAGSVITINQTYTGPTTGRDRNAELLWSLKYATRARG